MVLVLDPVGHVSRMAEDSDGDHWNYKLIACDSRDENGRAVHLSLKVKRYTNGVFSWQLRLILGIVLAARKSLELGKLLRRDINYVFGDITAYGGDPARHIFRSWKSLEATGVLTDDVEVSDQDYGISTFGLVCLLSALVRGGENLRKKIDPDRFLFHS